MTELLRAFGWAVVHSLWLGVVVGAVVFPPIRAYMAHRPGRAVKIAFATLLVIASAFVLLLFVQPNGALPGRVLAQLGIDGASDERVALSVDAASVVIGLLWCVLLGFGAVREWRARQTVRRWRRQGRAVSARRLLGPHVFDGASDLRIVLVRGGPRSPCVVGALRPRVLVPIEIARGLSREHLAMLLAHEAGHVERRDTLVHQVSRLLFATLSFHPVAWLLMAQMRRGREASCDDLAVLRCGDAVAYGSALLQLATVPARSARSPALAARDGDLLQRVRRLLCCPKAAGGRAVFAATALVVGFLALAVGREGVDLHHAAARTVRLRDLDLADRVWGRVWRGDRPILKVERGVHLVGNLPADSETGFLVVLDRGMARSSDGKPLPPGSALRGGSLLFIDQVDSPPVRFAVDALAERSAGAGRHPPQAQSQSGGASDGWQLRAPSTVPKR